MASMEPGRTSPEHLRETSEPFLASSASQREVPEEAQGAEASLPAGHEHLRELFETVPTAIFSCDVEGVIRHFNGRAVELWGKSPVPGVERYWGSNALLLPNGTVVPFDESPVAEVLRSGSPLSDVELTVERLDGSRVPVLANFAPLKDHRQEIAGVIASFVEITKRKARESMLRESEARFRLLAEAMPQKITMTNRLGTIVYANPQWLAYTGLSFEQMREQGWQKIIHPDDLEASTLSWNRSIESGEPFLAVYRLRRADGQFRWHISRALPVRNADGQILTWVRSSTDIDEAKQMDESVRAYLEEEVDHRTAELLAANEQLQGFTYSVAHDLRQQIRGISSYASILTTEASSDLNDESLEILSRLVDSSNRLARIVDDLLTYARLGKQEPAKT